MPNFVHFFVPLETGNFVANEVLALAFTENPIAEGGNVRVTLFGNAAQIRGIAVSQPAGRPLERREAIIARAVEHTLTVLRIGNDPGIELLRGAEGVFRFLTETDDEVPTWPVDIEGTIEGEPDLASIIETYQRTLAEPLATSLALLAEGLATNLPPHYRILSYIRALEHMLPNPLERRTHLDLYNAEFANLNVSRRRFGNAMDELRTRCAHGNPIGRGEATPFFGFGFRTPPEVQGLTNLLFRGRMRRSPSLPRAAARAHKLNDDRFFDHRN